MAARVYSHPAFLDSAACRSIRAAMDRGVAEPAKILDRAITLDRQVRLASSIDVDLRTLAIVEAALDSRRDSIGAFFGLPLTGREGAGFLRYQAGGFYRSHRDQGSVAGWPAAARRRISVVVFLNNCRELPGPGEFSGGQLRLLEDVPHDIVPREGLLVAFPASMLHEVARIGHGTRDVIVDWYY
jgi:predicted 2-oxoglutarate/Fe(II)-dependent dioxygenase YbiX